MKVTYPGSLENVLAFIRLPRSVRRMAKAQKPKPPRTASVRWMRATLLLLLIGALLMLAGGVQLVLAKKYIGFAPAGIVVLTAILLLWQTRRAAREQTLVAQWQAERSPEAPYTVEIDDAGFHFLATDIDRHIPWPMVTLVFETDTHVFVEDRQPMVYMVPKNAFPSPQDATSFVAAVRSRLGQNPPTRPRNES